MRGGAATGAAQLATLAVRVGSVMVLARLLPPADFGLVAMVTAVTALLQLLWTLGLPDATVQRPGLSHEQLSTLFWLNLAASAAGGLVLAALAPAVAWFYEQPRLVTIGLVLAASPVAEGLGLQHQALLRRRMEFGRLAVGQVAAWLLGAAAAIALAALGFGAWALVAQILVRGVVQSAGAWLLCGWRPGLHRRGAEVRPMLAYGAHLTGAGLMNRAGDSLGDILVGRFVGDVALGLFSRAESLLTLPKGALNAPLAGVAIPGLSRLLHQPERFRRYYQKAVLPPVLAGMPIVAFVFVKAEALLLAFLGPQWTDAVPIFRLLAPNAFIGTFNMATAWVFLACGLADRQLQWTLISVGVRMLMLLLGIHWGVYGVAAAFSASALITRVPSIVYGFRGTPVAPRDLWSVLWRPALASWIAGAGLFAVEARLGAPASAALSLASGLAIYVPGYLLAWLALPGGARILLENLALLRHMGRALPEPAGDAAEP